MIRQTLLISALVLASIPLAPEPASAQYITCESERGRTNRCRIDARYGVRLVRERSNAPCSGNWSYRNGYITVRDGCRGDFEAIRRNYDDDRYSGGSSNRQRVTCESVRGKTKSCPIDTRNGIRLIDELSNAPCRGNWRANRGYVTVRDGCRGVFESRRSSGGNWGGGNWDDNNDYGNGRYKRFGNIGGIGNFIVDRSSYYNNGQAREFDAIVNDDRERWWVNCRTGVIGQGDDINYASRGSRSRSPGEVVNFICNDRY